jgi:hypothetical protein
MRPNVGVLLTLGLALAAPGSSAAEPHGQVSQKALVGSGYVFPSTANTQGAGAYFRTRVVLTNPTGSVLTLLARLSTSGGFSAERTIALGSFQTRVYENFLSEVFDFTGGGGLNLVEQGASMGLPGRPFLAVAEVYAETVEGRYSTPVTGLSLDDMVVRPAIEKGYSMVTGLRANATNRANFGCSNADAVPVTVRAEVYTSNTPEIGSPAAVEEFSLPAGGWGQKAVPVQSEEIRILYMISSGGGALGTYCYGVNVNNASNDGTAIPASYVPMAE